MKKIVINLPDRTYRKFMKQKNEVPELEGADWAAYVKYLTRDVSLVDDFGAVVSRGTRKGLGEMWMENFIMNVHNIVDLDTYPEEKDIYSIGKLPKHEKEPALVVAAGPSIHAHNHIPMLAERGFKGKIITTDRMLIPLLEAGVIPAYVASVDGHREKILKWFDHPLVDEHGHKITGLFTTTSAPNAAQRLLDVGGKIYWFHGMLDNFFSLDSVTSFMNYMTGSTAVSCGGNVGTTSWMLAFYLKMTPIAFIGLDLGYTKDTPIEETAYYQTLEDSTDSIEEMQTFFREGVNPDFGNPWYSDLVMLNYKEALLEMISHIDPKLLTTINATEGGCVFGPGITSMKFSAFLDKYGER